MNVPALYVPVDSSFEPTSIAIAALASRGEAGIALLPSGRLTQRRVDEIVLTREGRQRRLQLVAQTGLGFGPAMYWATTEAVPRLFAALDPAQYTFIEAGWESAAAELAERQRKAESALLRDMAARLGHPPAGLGFDEIQHINQLLLNFFVTPTTDTRTLERFYLPSQRTADLDFGSEAVRDFVALLQQHRTVVDPTLVAFASDPLREGELAQPFAAVADHLPPDVKRSLRSGGLEAPDDATRERYRRSFARMVEFVGLLHRAGVGIVAGTDTLSGVALAGEFELYVQAGLTPAQVLQLATRDAARITRTSAERGSIAPGKVADLVLVDGDPTRDIADVRKVALVLTQGFWLSPAEANPVSEQSRAAAPADQANNQSKWVPRRTRGD